MTLQQCVSPPHHLNHSFPVSSLGNSIPCWGLLSALLQFIETIMGLYLGSFSIDESTLLSAQYLRASASAVRPKDRMGWTVLMWKDSLCHYHARYVNMECLQGSHSVPNLSFSCLYYSILLLQLSGSSSETIVDTQVFLRSHSF